MMGYQCSRSCPRAVMLYHSTINVLIITMYSSAISTLGLKNELQYWVIMDIGLCKFNGMAGILQLMQC